MRFFPINGLVQGRRTWSSVLTLAGSGICVYVCGVQRGGRVSLWQGITVTRQCRKLRHKHAVLEDPYSMIYFGRVLIMKMFSDFDLWGRLGSFFLSSFYHFHHLDLGIFQNRQEWVISVSFSGWWALPISKWQWNKSSLLILPAKKC